MLAFVTSYKQLKDTFDSCHLSSLKDYGEGRVTAFESIIANYQTRADAIKAKGVDTTTLDKILSDAKTQIVDPLKSEIEADTDAKTAQATLQKYCLFDGCKTGINFHLAAKFEIAKLNIALLAIQNTNATESQISQLKTDITSAQSALTSVGTSKYTDTTKSQVWNNIQAANTFIKQIKDILKTKTTTGKSTNSTSNTTSGGTN